MYSDLLKKMITKDDVDELRGELELLLTALYKTKSGSFEDTLKTSVRKWVAEYIREHVTQKGEDAETFLKTLSTELTALHFLQIRIAFEPTEDTYERIHTWLQENEKENFTIDLEYDPKILGGAVVIYQGSYKDFSLRSKLDAVSTEIIQKYLGKGALPT